ncbi:hypothetical protein [uncultured Sulfitobacter sp.]|jgi:hypothetical protein|nr:hypothetical protein [uncultured Sulfitobacter sp.]
MTKTTVTALSYQQGFTAVPLTDILLTGVWDLIQDAPAERQH